MKPGPVGFIQNTITPANVLSPEILPGKTSMHVENFKIHKSPKGTLVPEIAPGEHNCMC